jgi:hypothetical protein
MEPRLSARLGFYRARQGWGCEPTCDSIAATIVGRQARWIACWGIPEGILMNVAHLFVDWLL